MPAPTITTRCPPPPAEDAIVFVVSSLTRSLYCGRWGGPESSRRDLGHSPTGRTAVIKGVARPDARPRPGRSLPGDSGRVLGWRDRALAGARSHWAEREAGAASDRTNLIRVMPAKGGGDQPMHT